jgi:hypothetical protein
MSSAIRGLQTAQVAMVVTMTTMENTRVVPRRGCGNGHGQERHMGKTRDCLRFLNSSSLTGRELTTIYKDLISTFHYLH